MIAWILAACGLLAPGRDHQRIAEAIAGALAEAPPLFVADDDRRKTAAVVIAVAFREGSLRPTITGDKGESYCTMQVHRSSGGTPALNDDPAACIRAGLALLRTSMRVCPSHPIAWYAEGGTKSCESLRAQRISRDRMAIAARLRRDVP